MNSPSQRKPGAPVVGFNHNIGYKGRTFHVQTEDSGVQHGHVITHVFLGGNVLASVKKSYAADIALLAESEIFGAVRKLMEEQHKQMMRSLLAGQHDEEIARRTADNVYAPGVLAGGQKAPGLLVGGEMATPVPTPSASPRPVPTPSAQPRPVQRRTPAPPPRPVRPPPVGGDFALDEMILGFLAAEAAGTKR